MAIADAHGLPISVCTASASPAEVKLVQSVLEPLAQRKLLPLRLIADRAYDSDTLRSELKDQGVELICPHRRGRKRAKTQDGRALRRYKRRWKVERLFAWLGNQRRLVVRWEYKVENTWLSSNSLAPCCCSGIYEIASSHVREYNDRRALPHTCAGEVSRDK